MALSDCLHAVEETWSGILNGDIEGAERSHVKRVEVCEARIDSVWLIGFGARASEGGLGQGMVLGVELEANRVVGWDVREDRWVEDEAGAVVGAYCDGRERSGGCARAVAASSCGICAVLGLGHVDELLHLGLVLGVDTEDHAWKR